VRNGWNSDRFNVIDPEVRRKNPGSIKRKNLPVLIEDNCFSLVFDNGRDTIDLMAADSNVRDLWVKGLTQVIADCKNQRRENEYKL